MENFLNLNHSEKAKMLSSSLGGIITCLDKILCALMIKPRNNTRSSSGIEPKTF